MPRRTNPELILEAAGRVFGRSGYHAARVSEIAREAGVAQGTVYLYFASKEQLYLAVLDRFAGTLRETAEHIDWADIRSTAGLRDRFTNLYVRIFELCAANREVAGLLLGGPPVGARSDGIRAELLGAVEVVTVRYLEVGTAAGHFRPVSSEPIARAIVGYLLYTVARTIVEAGRTRALRELAEQLIDFGLYGLLAPEARSADAADPHPAARPAGSSAAP